MLFDHDLKRTLSISVETTMNRSYSSTQLPYKDNTITIEFRFKCSSVQAEILLDEIGIYDRHSSRCIAKFQPLDVNEEHDKFWLRMGFPYDMIDDHLPPPSNLSAVECVWLTEESEFWESEFEWCKENKEEICKEFETLKLHYENRLHQRETDEEKDSNRKLSQQFNVQDQREINFFNDALEFLSSNFDLKGYISKRCKEEMNTVSGVGWTSSGSDNIQRKSFFHRKI